MEVCCCCDCPYLPVILVPSHARTIVRSYPADIQPAKGQPQGLHYLTLEELEVWATDVYEELCHRRAGQPAEPAPQGLALLEDSAMMARSKMRCQERIRSTAAWGQQSSPPHGPKQAPAELPKPGS